MLTFHQKQIIQQDKFTILQWEIFEEQTKTIKKQTKTIEDKSRNSSPINFIGFQALLHFCRNILNSNIELAKSQEDKENFKSNLNKKAK